MSVEEGAAGCEELGVLVGGDGVEVGGKLLVGGEAGRVDVAGGGNGGGAAVDGDGAAGDGL